MKASHGFSLPSRWRKSHLAPAPHLGSTISQSTGDALTTHDPMASKPMKCRALHMLESALHSSMVCEFLQQIRLHAEPSHAWNEFALSRGGRQVAASKTSLKTLAGVHARFLEPSLRCASRRGRKPDGAFKLDANFRLMKILAQGNRPAAACRHHARARRGRARGPSGGGLARYVFAFAIRRITSL